MNQIPADPSATAAPHPQRSGLRFLVAYLAGWGVFIGRELFRSAGDSRDFSLVGWLLEAELDTYLVAVWLLLAPLAWFLRRSLFWNGGTASKWMSVRWKTWIAEAAGMCRSTRRAAVLSLLVGLTSLAASGEVGKEFDGWPPAYHDEYSYLFQARTFLAGRLSFPSHEAPRLFDQMHVLNEGRFASRYFPGTGLWLAPFVALGNPWWGHWLAGAVTAMLIFWTGRELLGDWGGFLAGILTALAPGMALFSNLLLAHHPTMVGLSLFLLGYLRCIRHCSTLWSVICGTGLAFAALCRPMTAAGVGFPFGIYLLVWLISAQRRRSEVASRLKVVVGMGIPLLAAGAGMLIVDRAITGDPLKTPYGVYTDLFTPRHRYGFNNVIRGEQHLNPRVLENYDRWAENLTPRLAARNVETRLIASWKWTLGILPLTLALVVGILCWNALDWGTRLVFAGIISLHAAHVPYWFVGIEDYHYVFESGPLWMLWTAAVTVQAFRLWQNEERFWMPAWWVGLLLMTVGFSYLLRGGNWSAPLAEGIGKVRYAREKYARFADRIAREARPVPALVLVDVDPADRHIDYVTNSPDLTGPVLFGRYLPAEIPLTEVRRLFPDRALFLYRPREDRLEPIPEAPPGRF